MRRCIVISWHRFYDPETGRYISADPIGLAGGMNLFAYALADPVNRIDPQGLADKWYGYNDKNFKDWVHGIKQDEGRAGSQNYTKKQIKDLHGQWEDEGRPRGKGGKSGRGGSYRGFKGRCVGILGLIGVTLDAIEAQRLYEECKEDPCKCKPDDCT